MLTIALTHIAGFVQNVVNSSSMTIYYKKYPRRVLFHPSTFLPQFFQASSARVCSLIVKTMNGFLRSSAFTR